MSDRSLPTAIASLVLRQRRALLLALLVLLHLVLLLGPDSGLGRLMFVAEIGLAILWQPFIRAELRISPLAGSLVGGAIAVAVLWLNWWVLAGWIMLSAGIVGGKIFFYASRWTKLFYLLALGYLVAALLLVVIPNLLPGGGLPGDAVAAMMHQLVPAIFVVMAVLPEEKEPDAGGEAIDFIYTVFVFLMLAVLALGAVAAMLMFRYGYPESVLLSLLVAGALLMVLGWAWNPHAGFTGVGNMFSRYLLSIGMPVEQWLHTLADLAQRHDEPQKFLADACDDMVRRLPWIKGGDWSDGQSGGDFGTKVGERSEFRIASLTIGIYAARPLSPTLVWHFNLLAQLLGEFYEDKRRARELRRLSYVEAIHETGARLTHDIKNLLQSLHALCDAVESGTDEPSPELIALFRRQLPVISQRLGTTLEKLQVPQEDERERLRAGAWFERICRRYADLGIECSLDRAAADRMLPLALFDSAAENLLQNAIDKRRLDAALHIRLRLHEVKGRPALEVDDDGASMPAALAAKLLHEPVSSENGLGIGLYQVARQAELSGYRLALAENRMGRVRFSLAAVS